MTEKKVLEIVKRVLTENEFKVTYKDFSKKKIAPVDDGIMLSSDELLTIKVWLLEQEVEEEDNEEDC